MPNSNHTQVAPETQADQTNDSQTSEARIYHSIADYAEDGRYLLDELREIGGVLDLLIEACHDRYEDQLGNALTLINKSQHSIYHQMEEKLQILSQKTAGLQTQG
jgi:hypothetical protein